RVIRDSVAGQADAADKLPEKIPPGRSPDALSADQRAELDRAGTRLDQSAEQAGQLLGKADRFAREKEKEAADARAAAAAKDKEADELRKKAAGQPPGSPEARQAREKAAEA